MVVYGEMELVLVLPAEVNSKILNDDFQARALSSIYGNNAKFQMRFSNHPPFLWLARCCVSFVRVPYCTAGK